MAENENKQEVKKTPVGKCLKCGANVYEFETAKIGKIWKCEHNNKDNQSCDFILYENMNYFNQKVKLNTRKVATLLDHKVVPFKLKSKAGKNYEAYMSLVINGKYVNLQFEDYVNKRM